MRRTLVILGLAVLALFAVGFVLLASASSANAMRLHHGDKYYFVIQQGKWLVIALAGMCAAAFIDYRVWRDRPWLTVALYVAVCILLVAALKSRAINGSHRWVILGGLRLQPGEFAKLLAVLATGVYLDRLGWRIESFWKGVCTCLLLTLPMGLAVLEPDFGTTMVIGVTGSVLLFVGGMKLWHMCVFGAVGLCGVGAVLAKNANRMNRIMAFMSRADEMSGGVQKDANHQLNQSLVAFGNGIQSNLPPWWDSSSVYPFWNALTGVGFMESLQKEKYLPEAHTDFIFAIGAEEWGLVFSLGMLLLYAVVFACGVRIAFGAKDRFGRLLAFGCTFLLFFQVLFNIGVVTGCLPTKGLALPFVSYGGTNLLVSMMSVGFLFNVGRNAGGRMDLPNGRTKSRMGASSAGLYGRTEEREEQ